MLRKSSPKIATTIFLVACMSASGTADQRVRVAGILPQGNDIILDPGRTFTVGDVTHVRGQVLQSEIQGDLAGIQTIIFNLDLNNKTLVGNVHNLVKLDVTWVDQGLSGTFRGHFAGHVRNGVLEGRIAYEGSGDFSGMKFFARAYGLLGAPHFIYEGEILVPRKPSP